MGASLEFMYYTNKNKDEVAKAFNSDVENCQYENGHSYSGGIGMLDCISLWVAKTFATVDEAENYICDHQEKWDGAMAAQTTEGTWVVGGWCSE
jgi:uncharacterized protein YggL (DUF469 family)